MDERNFFLYGLFYLLSMFITSLFWLFKLNFPLPQSLRFLLYIGVILLFLYLSLYWFIPLKIAKRHKWFIIVLFPIFEYVLGLGDTGFPWFILANVLSPIPILIQLASVGGVMLLSSWVLTSGYFVYKLIKERDYKWLYINIIVIALPIIFGLLRIYHKTSYTDKTVVIVQPNIPGNMKGGMSRDSLIRAQIKLLSLAKKYNPFVVVLPETGTLSDLFREGRYRDMYVAVSKSLKAPIITGMPVFKTDGVYNACVTVNRDFISPPYAKIHLTPFGEAIPYDDKIPFLKSVDVRGGHMNRGKEFVVQRVKRTRFGILICFETIFPEITLKWVRKKIDVLVNITNDGWFGKTPAPYQHAHILLLRAVESGLPVIRSANNGISFIADAYGRISVKMGLFKKGIIHGKLPKRLNNTLYNVIGDKILFIYLLIAAAFVLWQIFKKREKSLED